MSHFLVINEINMIVIEIKSKCRQVIIKINRVIFVAICDKLFHLIVIPITWNLEFIAKI